MGSMSESIDDIGERLAAVTAGYDFMSSMVWKFCDMSFLDDEPESMAILDAADAARYKE